MSVSKTILLGNLGDDVKIRTFDNGGKIATFPLATSENWKNKETGEKMSKTTWHNIVCKNGKVADILEKYLSKGDKLYLEGVIDNREYTDKEGVKKYISEIVLLTFDFVGTKGTGDSTPTPAKPSGKTPQEDDDLPF